MELKSILLQYAFTLFAIFFSLNLHTAFYDFYWFLGGGQAFSAIFRTDIYQALEFWYLIAGLLYLAIPGIFVGFVSFRYIKAQSIEIKTKTRLIFETGFMTVIGLFPVVTLHMIRLFLTYVPKIDPEFPKQVAYLASEFAIEPEQWSLNLYPVSPEAHALGYYSLFVVISYFCALFIFDLLTGHRITWQKGARSS